MAQSLTKGESLVMLQATEANPQQVALEAAYLDSYKNLQVYNSAAKNLEKAVVPAKPAGAEMNGETTNGELEAPKAGNELKEQETARNNSLNHLKTVQNEWTTASLEGNQKAISAMEETEKNRVEGYLALKIASLETEIKTLKGVLAKSDHLALVPGVIDEEGKQVSAEDANVNDGESE